MATKRKTKDQASVRELVERRADDSSHSGKNRAVVMELKEQIADVLARGYKWRIIWQALHDAGRIEMGYDTFRAHCRAVGLEAAPNTYNTADTKKRDPES